MKHKSLEMKYLVSCVALNLLFLANFVSALVDSTTYENTNIKEDGKTIQFFEISRSFQLSCDLTEDEKKLKFEWRKEDTPISKMDNLNSRSSFEPKGRLTVKETTAADAGNYSCVLLGDTETKVTIPVSTKPAMKLAINTNVVEGEKLILVCTVLGNPMPIVTWKIAGNRTLNMSDERIKIGDDPDTKVMNAVLTIEDVQLSDREHYTCRAESPYSPEIFKERVATVRVKDKLAALWPFLGICAEVFVLCAIILVYEKKRNKTELDESDTDQSPDQKNTSDHGKDSDVRHRK